MPDATQRSLERTPSRTLSWGVAPAAIAPGELASAAQFAGLAVFFAGIAVGTLLVFTDRHGYERPVPARVVGLLLLAGAGLTIAGRLGQYVGV